MASRAKHALHRIVLKNSVANMKRNRTITAFAEKMGFVYFGHVDSRDDEHRVVRGLTVSSTHTDDNYTVGSFDGHDVSIVDRLDTVSTAEGNVRSHRWLIFEIDLFATDIPHIFIGDHSHTDSSYARLFTAFPALQHVPLGTFENYSVEFSKRYSIFSVPSQFIETQRYFTAEVTRMLAAHFWPFVIEVYDGALYIYSDVSLVTPTLLETMLKNGLWLAKQLDTKAGFTDE